MIRVTVSPIDIFINYIISFLSKCKIVIIYINIIYFNIYLICELLANNNKTRLGKIKMASEFYYATRQVPFGFQNKSSLEVFIEKH